MMDNQHEVLIHKNSSFVGTGHNSEIVTDKWVMIGYFIMQWPQSILKGVF